MLDPALKQNSTPMQVKCKGIGAVGKYEFGVYQLVSGKAGWIKTQTKSTARQEVITSQNKKSFVVVANKKDSVIVNVSNRSILEGDKGSWFSRNILNCAYIEVVTNEEIFEGVFTFLSDSNIWNMALIYLIDHEYTGNGPQFRGVMSDGTTDIEIRHVIVNEEGTNNMLNPVMGFEFFIESKSVAAVQVMPNNKMVAWIHREADKKMQFVLASGVVALLVKTM